jgi:hypothetical protein
MNAPALINVRAMIHPSERGNESNILEFWKPFGDTVIPQYLEDKGLAGEVPTDDLFCTLSRSATRVGHCP